jgi:hypothetical protein
MGSAVAAETIFMRPEASMDSLLFLCALVAVAWTVVWTIMNDARPEAKDGSYNARGRRKSQIPSQNPPPA